MRSDTVSCFSGVSHGIARCLYAVLLGFVAVTVWEGYDRAQAAVEREADDLADLFRDAQTFPRDTRTQIENQVRNYVGLVVEKVERLETRIKATRSRWLRLTERTSTHKAVAERHPRAIDVRSAASRSSRGR